MLVSFSYCDNTICFVLFFCLLFNLCKYVRIYGLKVVNITEILILILKIDRLTITITITIIIIVVIIIIIIII